MFPHNIQRHKKYLVTGYDAYHRLTQVRTFLFILSFLFVASIQQRSVLAPVPFAVQGQIHSHEDKAETLKELAEVLLTGCFEHIHTHEGEGAEAAHSHSHQHSIAGLGSLIDFVSSSFYFSLVIPKREWTLSFSLPPFESYCSELLRPPIGVC